jgi:hypothetical protein
MTGRLFVHRKSDDAALDDGASGRDWAWAVGLLAALAGVTWVFDRFLNFF